MDTIKSMIREAETKNRGRGRDEKSSRFKFMRPTDQSDFYSKSDYGNVSSGSYSKSRRWEKSRDSEKQHKDRRVDSRDDRTEREEKGECKKVNSNFLFFIICNVQFIIVTASTSHQKEESTEISEMPSVEEEKIPTEADLNKLGAKIVKAEIMGDEVCYLILIASLKATIQLNFIIHRH